jgi:hypothetical protein
LENSTGGFVGETHKLLLAPQDLGWRVVGDVTVPISNNLLVKPGARASDLRKIVSHPEALKECANWLKTKFPQLAQESMSSTAAAAEAVSKGDGTIAAIASSAAARVYDLQILFSNIQDNQHTLVLVHLLLVRRPWDRSALRRKHFKRILGVTSRQFHISVRTRQIVRKFHQELGSEFCQHAAN